MKMLRRARLAISVAFFLPWLAMGLAAQDEAGEPTLRDSGPLTVIRIDGSINPASSDYIQRAILESEEAGARALLMELDTPGGLVSSTQDIIQAMLRSKVPIIVYVSPQGAWAGSAGTFITIAGHVAAMAPGSTIGAAHPVGVGGGGGGSPEGEEGKAKDHAAAKAENMLTAYMKAIAEERGRNVEWAQDAVRNSVAITADRAVELNVVDLVADDRADLLEQLEGREVKIGGEIQRLAFAGAVVQDIEMQLLTRIFNVLASPDVAVLLFMAGVLGLYVEMNQPGMIFPGVAGALCLLLALIAFQILPFSWVGVLLMLVGLGLMVAEAFVTSFGLLFASGAACMLLGGSMLFDRPELSDLDVSFWPVLVPAVGGLGAFGALVVFAVGRSMRRRQESGVYELIGMEGVARTAIDPSGTVFIRGEYWTARSPELIPAEARVVAERVEGLTLHVRPVPADEQDRTS
ncbi:MAG: nodulation protein NfeD [Deltaproteobacteria bacterium]|nr:nodulation protein NfeD [Deltaproteobacteria bacterium]MBW2395041.1 nodulation protein NfeD [Deltaproteobacteria bacterium]